MKRTDELLNQNCQDVWPKLYYHIAHSLIRDFGIKGEKAIRVGLRKYGVDRGTALRKLHIENGYPINMYTLFSVYDLPDDPRCRRRSIRLNKSERLSETLVCPIADLWISYGAKDLGRIYCEEFHHAMYGAYAAGTQVNLGQTLTQEGDSHCRFSVYYREANTEGDFDGRELNFDDVHEMPYRDGIEMIVVKLYNNLYQGATEILGAEAIPTVASAMKELAKDVGTHYREFAKSLDVPVTDEWLNHEFPFHLGEGAPYGYWLEYDISEQWNIYKRDFEPEFLKHVKSQM